MLGIMLHVSFSEFLNKWCLLLEIMGFSHLWIICTRINVTTLIPVRMVCYFRLQLVTRRLQSCNSTRDEGCNLILITIYLFHGFHRYSPTSRHAMQLIFLCEKEIWLGGGSRNFSAVLLLSYPRLVE